MVAYAVLAILISLFAPEVIRILATDEYLEAVYMMPPVAAGIFMISLSNIYSNVLIYHRNTKTVMIASSIAAFSNVVLNLIGIRKYGYMAAAYTTLISYVIMAVFQCIVSNRIHSKADPEDTETVYENHKILWIALVMAVGCFGIEFVYHYTILRYALIIAIMSVCFVSRKRIMNMVKETSRK